MSVGSPSCQHVDDKIPSTPSREQSSSAFFFSVTPASQLNRRRKNGAHPWIGKWLGILEADANVEACTAQAVASYNSRIQD